MNILEFLKGLVPSFFKKDIKQKIDQIQMTLSSIVQPAVDAFRGGLNEKQLKSSFAKDFYSNFLGYIQAPFKGDPAPYSLAVDRASTNAIKLLDLLEQFIQTRLSETVEIEGLTYQKATVLRLIEMLDFFADYSIRNLAALTAAETNILAFGKPDGNPTTKRELAYLMEHRNAYIKLIAILVSDPKTIMAKLDDVPEVYVSAELGTTPALQGGQSDPLHLGSIAAISFIFHWVGIRMADWDAARWDRAQKDKMTLTLRLEALKSRQRNAPDARLEAMIQGSERELVLLRDRIDRIEAKARPV